MLAQQGVGRGAGGGGRGTGAHGQRLGQGRVEVAVAASAQGAQSRGEAQQDPGAAEELGPQPRPSALDLGEGAVQVDTEGPPASEQVAGGR